MDNDAFKDLVRKQANLGSSSKEIARKAVEDEFRKKKKRKRGGGYASSSDEEDDDDGKSKKNKRRDNEKEEDEEDTEKAIQDDLASRYRDRAKERREGGADEPSDDDAEHSKPMSLASNEFLIVPHNKKGLDLSLVRKERQRFRKSESIASAKDKVPGIEIRKEMPSMEEAFEILKNQVDESSSATPSVALSRGLAGYLQGFMEWKMDGIQGKYDAVRCGNTGKTLQNTKFALAIDGNPSDTAKAWEKPRQFTLSDGTGSGNLFSNSSAMLTSEVHEQVEQIFTSRQRMLSQMKQATAAPTSKRSKGSFATSGKAPQEIAEAAVKSSSLCDEDDDDIFGGLDDYVPPVPRKKD